MIGSRWLYSSILISIFSCSGSQAQQSQSPVEETFEQALVALQANRLQEALDAFTAVIKARPDDARAHNFRGITLMSLGESDEAAKEYLRATELDGQMEDAFRNLGYLEWNRGQNELARQHLDRALKLAPDDAFAAYYLARLEFENNNQDKALSLLRRFADHKTLWARFNLALGLLLTGKYQAAADLAQVLSQDKQAKANNLASAYSIVGIAKSKIGRENESVAAFRKAATLAPELEEHWLNLSREQMELKRLAEAIASVQEGLQANPKSYALHLRLGAAYFSSGKYAEAEAQFRHLVSLNDPLPTSSIGLAQVLLHTGRASEAATVLADAERRLGPQFLIVYFKGLALDRAGNRAEALQSYRRAMQLSPNSAEAHFGAGKVSLALGHPTEAIPELQKVLELDPGNVPAKRLLSQAYAKVGDREKATLFASTVVPPEREATPGLVGDFILPDWQQPDGP